MFREKCFIGYENWATLFLETLVRAKKFCLKPTNKQTIFSFVPLQDDQMTPLLFLTAKCSGLVQPLCTASSSSWAPLATVCSPISSFHLSPQVLQRLSILVFRDMKQDPEEKNSFQIYIFFKTAILILLTPRRVEPDCYRRIELPWYLFAFQWISNNFYRFLQPICLFLSFSLLVSLFVFLFCLSF